MTKCFKIYKVFQFVKFKSNDLTIWKLTTFLLKFNCFIYNSLISLRIINVFLHEITIVISTLIIYDSL